MAYKQPMNSLSSNSYKEQSRAAPVVVQIPLRGKEKTTMITTTIIPISCNVKAIITSIPNIFYLYTLWRCNRFNDVIVIYYNT